MALGLLLVVHVCRFRTGHRNVSCTTFSTTRDAMSMVQARISLKVRRLVELVTFWVLKTDLNWFHHECIYMHCPAYCIRRFCYVDVATCKRESYERVYRSSYFSFESEVDIFYSYSTCNSSADDWLAVEEDIVRSRALGGISIDANVPYYVLPSKCVIPMYLCLKFQLENYLRRD